MLRFVVLLEVVDQVEGWWIRLIVAGVCNSDGGSERTMANLRGCGSSFGDFAWMAVVMVVKVNYGKFGSLLAEVKAIHGKKPEDV